MFTFEMLLISSSSWSCPWLWRILLWLVSG